MNKMIIAGIGTGVGKTLVSCILAHLLNADYWKPIECGSEEDSDTAMLKSWGIQTHPPAYSLKAPLSPHQAAKLENCTIDKEAIQIPATTRPLIIESVGGILVPLSHHTLSIDLFSSWDCRWVLVSRHYLGSLNHTLLSLEALKHRNLPLQGIIFNGVPNPEGEAVILDRAQAPLLGRLLPETHITKETLNLYARQWKL